MNIQITETKQYYNRKLQMWQFKVYITYKHKKYIKIKEYFGFNGSVTIVKNKIFTIEMRRLDY